MKKLLLSALALLIASPALAADLPVKAALAQAPVIPTCAVAGPCTGFTLGFHLEGAGSNADILGSGLNGSIFNDGAGLGVQAGYQFWNGQFFIAGEAGGTFYTGSNPALATIVGLNPNWSADVVAKAGYGINGLFNSPPAGTQPITPIQALNGAMLTPYFIVGERFRDHLNGFIAGAGVAYSLGGHSEVFVDYKHVTYNQNTLAGLIQIGSEQSVTAGYNYKF